MNETERSDEKQRTPHGTYKPTQQDIYSITHYKTHLSGDYTPK